MRTCVGVVAFFVGCVPSSPAVPEAVPASITAKVDVCQSFRQALPTVVLPLQLPQQTSLDPFVLELQEWLRARVVSTGVYSPIGRWRHESGSELWLIERIAPEGLFYYALLVDSACGLLDTALWGRQVVQTDRLEQASFRLDREGRCQITEEVHTTSFVGEQPHSAVTRQTRLYAVDWAAGKLRPL